MTRSQRVGQDVVVLAEKHDTTAECWSCSRGVGR